MSPRDAAALGPAKLDAPNSYIGRSVPRPNARRLAAGQARYVDDIQLPRLVHVVFVRSPHAHARIQAIDTAAAAAAPGVVRVATGDMLAPYCSPWVGVLTHLRGLRSAPQVCLPTDRVLWQGEPVVAVVAHTLAQAQDAADRVEVSYEALPPLVDPEAALDPIAVVLHPDLGSNLAFERRIAVGDVDAAIADAAAVVERTFYFSRHTGVTLEPRAILADYHAADQSLVVYLSSQAPHMMQDLLAKHLGLAETQVRVLCHDVGGSFGVKIHVYPDEMAAAALSVMLKRPVKFVADRIESFVSDIHAREHRVRARMALSDEGHVTAIDVDGLTGVGPYSAYPRTSGVETNQVVNLIGAPYRVENYRARTRVVFQNKTMMSQYRAVGHPIACAVTEGLIDAAARELGIDVAEIRRRNLIADNSYPCASATGMRFESLSHQAALDKILTMMDYPALRADQADGRRKGIWRGIGLAPFVEITNPSPAFYGAGGAHIAAQDGCTVRLDASGSVVAQISVTEQGQGTETMVAQVVATAFGVPFERVRVITGDTDNTPYGGGTWASRATGIGGEAAVLAARALRDNVLAVAAAMLQAKPEDLDIRQGLIVDRVGASERLELAQLARTVYFRTDLLPQDLRPELVATRHFVPRAFAFAFTNGVQASHLEVDPDTGFIKLLHHWVVEDCGTIINPLLVDEQIRGGVVQGLGGALYEECLYDAAGQMMNANMADYLVPMAGEMPDIDIGHVETPTRESTLGAKGVGEAGVAGAPAAVMNAINDALSPFGVELTTMPFTPQRILRALGRVAD
jgi:aerobic carbon-monoxide dehydrogenase large subunit